MKRAILWMLLLSMAGCYPVSFAYRDKYFGSPRAKTETKTEYLREVKVKHPDGRLIRLGYAKKTWYSPPGTDLDEKFMVYFLYDDQRELIARYETTGELYHYVAEFGKYRETYKGTHTLNNALRLLFGFGAKANVFIGELDPYRGG